MYLNVFEFVLRPCDGRMVHRVDIELGGVRLDIFLGSSWAAWDLVGDRISVRDVGVSLDPLKDRFGKGLPWLRTAHWRNLQSPWFRFSCDLSDHRFGSELDMRRPTSSLSSG